MTLGLGIHDCMELQNCYNTDQHKANIYITHKERKVQGSIINEFVSMSYKKQKQNGVY